MQRNAKATEDQIAAEKIRLHSHSLALKVP